VTDARVEIRDQSSGSGELCRTILGALPTWFGIPESVEDYVAVAERSPTGIGGAMLRHTEATLAGAGVEFLQVKTLSASHPDEGYDKTRAFYRAHGFRALQEFPDLWGPRNPALQMVKVVAPPGPR
jgi:hypothetical protein